MPRVRSYRIGPVAFGDPGMRSHGWRRFLGFIWIYSAEREWAYLEQLGAIWEVEPLDGETIAAFRGRLRNTMFGPPKRQT